MTCPLSKLKKKEYDRKRYMRKRDELLAYQRNYYREHREQVRAKVKECQNKREERQREELWKK